MKQNLKPFDLQAALAGKPVVTRDGQPVKIAGYNEDAQSNHHIVGWVDGHLCAWDSSGKVSSNNKKEDEDDLFMAPEKREVWVCLYRLGDSFGLGQSSTKRGAEAAAHGSKGEVITTVKIHEYEI